MAFKLKAGNSGNPIKKNFSASFKAAEKSSMTKPKSPMTKPSSMKLRTEDERPTLEEIQAQRNEAHERLRSIGINQPLSDFSFDQQVALQQLARKAKQGGGMNEAAINAAKNEILNPTRVKGENE